MPQLVGEANLGDAHVVAQKSDDLVRVRGTRFPFDTGVDVLGVLPEDHHVGFFRSLHRARYAVQPAHGTLADVQVEVLAQRDVQRPDATAHRRRHRSFDANHELAHRGERLLGQPLVGAVDRKGLLARVDLHPHDLAGSAVRLGHCRVDDLDHHRRDVDADPVALDERDDRLVGHVQSAVLGHRDLLAGRRHLDVFVAHALASLALAGEKRGIVHQPTCSPMRSCGSARRLRAMGGEVCIEHRLWYGREMAHPEMTQRGERGKRAVSQSRSSPIPTTPPHPVPGGAYDRDGFLYECPVEDLRHFQIGVTLMSTLGPHMRRRHGEAALVTGSVGLYATPEDRALPPFVADFLVSLTAGDIDAPGTPPEEDRQSYKTMAGAAAGPCARNRLPSFASAGHRDETSALRGTPHPGVLGVRSGGHRSARRATGSAAHRRPIPRRTTRSTATRRDAASCGHDALVEPGAWAVPVRGRQGTAAARSRNGHAARP